MPVLMRFGFVGSNNMLGGRDKGRASHPFFSVAENLWSFDLMHEFKYILDAWNALPRQTESTDF